MENKTRKLRIGVFGGARGRTMIDVLLNHPDAELVAVCDKYVPLLDWARDAAKEAGMEIALFETFDFNSRGGATFLGPKKTVVKMHGCANTDTTVASIEQIIRLTKANFSEEMAKVMAN